MTAGEETVVTPGLAQVGISCRVQPGMGSAWGSGVEIVYVWAHRVGGT